MLASQTKALHQLNKYYMERVQPRKMTINKSLCEIVQIVQDILKEVEAQEPRFISTLTEVNGRFEGLEVISPTDMEIVLFLNQMGVFNFVDDGSIPGCAVLKLSDGRKRSMSLWVEFITASGKTNQSINQSIEVKQSNQTDNQSINQAKHKLISIISSTRLSFGTQNPVAFPDVSGAGGGEKPLPGARENGLRQQRSEAPHPRPL